MRNYNEFSALWRAPLFSKPFYQDVGLNWRGIGARYLLMLVVLCWVVVLIQWTIGFSNFVNNEAPTALKDFPPIKIDHGKASSPVKQPYIMKDDKGRPIFVLDTTGEVKEPSDIGAMILLTETEWIQQDRSGRVERRPLSGFPDLEVDQSTLLGWLRLGRNLVLPAGLVGFTIFSLAYHLILALAYGGIAMAFNSGFRGKLTFDGAMRIAVMAMTAPILIDTILWLTHLPGGCIAWFLYQAITLGYVAFGVKAVADLTRPVSGFPLEYAPTNAPAVPPGDSQFP